ncbi:MAG: VWA domain-containing protein [Gammaproteobacteria bacterium]|nr:VWA domain-containing protein [Gammaproteobacteria bacterium]
MFSRIILIFVLLTLTSAPAYANSFDVVIVIDQSGSMSGSNTHPTANDKHGFRISITKNILNRLAEHAEGTSFVHRVSIIEFGTRVEVFLSNLELAYDPNAPGAALQKIQTNIYALKPRKMGYTDTADVLQEVLAELNNMNAGRASAANRQQYVLIITDGRPYRHHPYTSTAKLQKEIKRHVSALKKGALWVVGLNDADNYWNTGDGFFWKGLTEKDQARLADPAYPNIASVTRYILDRWLKVAGNEVHGDMFFCPPYLRRLTFDVHFNKPGARGIIRIIDPNGLTVPLASGGSGHSMYERYEIDDPEAGNYQIKKDTRFSYKVYAEKYAPSAIFLAPKSTIKQNIDTSVIFQLRRMNAPINLIPGLPLEANIRIVTPSGASAEPTANSAGNGKFSVSWKPVETGKHQLSFSGVVRFADNSQYDLFSDNAQLPVETVEVLAHIPKPPFWLHLDTPEPDGGVSIHPWSENASIKVALQETPDERIMDLAAHLHDPDQWISVKLMDKSGVPILPNPIPLKKDEEGYFIGEVPLAPLKLNWKRGQGLFYPGQLNLQFEVEQDGLLDDRTLDGVWLPDEMAERRVNGQRMSVGGIEVGLSWWIKLSLLAGLLALISVVVAAFATWVWPLISIRIEDKGRPVDLLVFHSVNDPDASNPVKRSIAGQLSSKLDGLKVQAEDGEHVAKQFRVERILGMEIPSVRIEYCWQHGAPHHIQLMGNKPRPLADVSDGNYVVQLKYTKRQSA